MASPASFSCPPPTCSGRRRCCASTCRVGPFRTFACPICSSWPASTRPSCWLGTAGRPARKGWHKREQATEHSGSAGRTLIKQKALEHSQSHFIPYHRRQDLFHRFLAENHLKLSHTLISRFFKKGWQKRWQIKKALASLPGLFFIENRSLEIIWTQRFAAGIPAKKDKKTTLPRT